MLKKSQIFYFLASFIITFVAGFFVWEAINQVDSETFTASLSDSINENIIPVTDLEQEIPVEQPVTTLGPQSTPVISVEDQLDDIQEKLDIIQQQVNELIVEQNRENQSSESELNKDEEIKDDKEEDLKEEDLKDEYLNQNENTTETVSCIGQININTASAEDLDKITEVGPATSEKIISARPFYSLDDLLKVSGIGQATLQKIKDQGCAYVEPGFSSPVSSGGSGSSAPGVPSGSYPEILISEVQISPIEQRFVELYNPNNTDVDLTGWYLQRKTSSEYTSFVTKTDFLGKIIKANDYFLISRSDITADIIMSDLTLTPNNSLALKNPDQDITDENNWLEITEGLSWCYDFELCQPTPKAQNIKYVEPAPIDTDAPQVVFELAPTQTTLNFVVNFTITDISATTTPSGLAVFNFRWSDDGGATWNEKGLQEILGAPLSVNLIETVSGSNGQVFSFQAKATDVAGNLSNWLPATPATTTISLPVAQKAILINEIQIEGSTTKDDWVELYNPNNFDIDISQWSIQRSPASGTIYRKNFVSGNKILAGGYFLIVRNDADQKYLDLADMTCSALQLSDSSTVYLVKNQENITDGNDLDIIDKVGIGADSFSPEGTYAPIPPAGESITRTVGIDTNDNSLDFIILDIPTPKAQ